MSRLPRRSLVSAVSAASLLAFLVVGGCGEATPEKKESPSAESTAKPEAGGSKAKKGKMEVKSIKGRIGAGSEKLE